MVTKGWAKLRLSVVDEKLRGGNSAWLTLDDLKSWTVPELKKEAEKEAIMNALHEVVLGPQGSETAHAAADGSLAVRSGGCARRAGHRPERAGAHVDWLGALALIPRQKAIAVCEHCMCSLFLCSCMLCVGRLGSSYVLYA